MAKHAARRRLKGQALKLAHIPDRKIVYQLIDDRFEKMADNGALQEVEQLVARGLSADLPIMKALGVSALSAYLRGRLTNKGLFISPPGIHGITQSDR